MNPYALFTITLAAGLGIGATISKVVEAQSRPPAAYVIVQTQLTGDAAAYVKDYVANIPASLEPFGGHFLVRGGTATRIEGEEPLPRVSILAFDSIEKAKAWYNSPSYQKLVPVRQRAMKTNSIFAESPTN